MESKMLCPYCSTEFSPKMKDEYEYSIGCESSAWGRGHYIDLIIDCDSCSKTVYKKTVFIDTEWGFEYEIQDT